MADEEDIITTLIKNEIHNRKKKKNPKGIYHSSMYTCLIINSIKYCCLLYIIYYIIFC